MAGPMFVIIARDGACSSYNNYNSWLENMSSSLLFHFQDKTLDALKIFDLYKFAPQMYSDPVLMTFELP